MNEWEVVSYEKGLSWICGKNVIEKCTSLLEKAEEVFKKKSSSHSVLLKYIPNKSTSDSEFEVL